MATRETDNDDYEKPRKIPKTLKEKDSGKRLIIILEKASLEAVKVGSVWWIIRALLRNHGLLKE